MIAPFDIFMVYSSDGMVWIEAVAELEAAKARVAVLMLVKPCEYLISPKKQGRKFQSNPLDLHRER